ncbi:16S rRNA (adenine(1518)-N(6)/adenine(1519)-N(6))-dimethyltransferase, partial [Patescibacteria group bacterium]|nr:16S rRNA (adenine(1518)-N(6)/adenine(1519)-N(6))-dimethyltransferase [Patescibacteria group bacterium]
MLNILKQHNIHPSKLRGQNFLVNKGIVEKIIKAGELSKKDTVLEIGPGLGVLTEELVKKAGKVIAVEKDKKLYELLRERFKNALNLKLINADVLHYSLPTTHHKLVANIPYNITGKIFRKFLSGESRPQMLVVMVQKEVGEKLLGKKSKSMLSL